MECHTRCASIGSSWKGAAAARTCATSTARCVGWSTSRVMNSRAKDRINEHAITVFQQPWQHAALRPAWTVAEIPQFLSASVTPGLSLPPAMAPPDIDKVFTGSIPKLYETYLVPLIFEPYAADLAARVGSRRVS